MDGEWSPSKIHKKLRTELENYILAQYFSKSPILSEAITEKIDSEGLLYQTPFLEASPAYQRIENGFNESDLPEWVSKLFSDLADQNIGVFRDPYSHQIDALKGFLGDKNILISTGTGSGKTECFIWPILAKLFQEAMTSKSTWSKRGIRVLLIYPMNALVSDQISRLRRLIGDDQNVFLEIFKKYCGPLRRPQFGMYTGRTPYPGMKQEPEKNKAIGKSYEEQMDLKDKDPELYKKLIEGGKLPAKYDFESYYQALKNGKIESNSLDAELVTRFEIQEYCPDLLISNYSMLEYMLMRTIEDPIWNQTREWLNHDSNKLLIVLDEAHMYKGSSGGEVAFLLKRLLRKLNIESEKVQFILTTASMPNPSRENNEKIKKFCSDLTGCNPESFMILRGQQEDLNKNGLYSIDSSFYNSIDLSNHREENEELENIRDQFLTIDRSLGQMEDKEIKNWLYCNLPRFKEIVILLETVRGKAVSIKELSDTIFPNIDQDEAQNRIEKLVYLLQFAIDTNGNPLFPVRLHLLFKGINGVYSCLNPNCPHSHQHKGAELGEVLLNGGYDVCPECGSQVYRLYTHRDCGALFIKGFIQTKSNHIPEKAYLWSDSTIYDSEQFKEIYFYIPQDKDDYPRGSKKNPIKPCYLDYRSGFIEFNDDSLVNDPKYRKLYYCSYSPEMNMSLNIFTTCPHCRRKLSERGLSDFEVKGNQPFFSLVKTQFLAQPPVVGKEKYPNQGRKVLLFSDSRQQAAKLALEMSELSDIAAMRQLFARAIAYMNEKDPIPSLGSIYSYICLAASNERIDLFDDSQRMIFRGDLEKTRRKIQARKRRKKTVEAPDFGLEEAPKDIHEFILRFFCAGYNKLSDIAFCWLEPSEESWELLYDTLDDLEISDDAFRELFNAWVIDCFYRYSALGPSFSAAVRNKVRFSYDHDGLPATWSLPKNILYQFQMKEEDQRAKKLKDALQTVFLQANDEQRYYIKLGSVSPICDESHDWFKCEKCGNISPYTLKGICPNCSSSQISKMDENDYETI